jgi:hypothetical protein
MKREIGAAGASCHSILASRESAGLYQVFGSVMVRRARLCRQARKGVAPNMPPRIQVSSSKSPTGSLSMRTATTIARYIVGALFILALTSQTPLRAAEPFEGVWARTQAECLDDEGPNSRTLIDLGNVIDGKPAPIFDQYENHCRIERKSVAGDRTNLSVTCFEFWEDFTKGTDGRKATIRLSPGRKSALKIDGTPYQRCAVK